MKHAKKLLALLLAMIMCFTVLAGCGKTPGEKDSKAPDVVNPTSKPEDKTPDEGDTTPKADPNTPLVVGYSPFSSKFTPFFASTAYDQDVVSMTQMDLLVVDRANAVIYKGIEGETHEYNGTDYTYYGPADVDVTLNNDGSVFYDVTLRDDLVFADGEPITIDDVIFSMYVLADPTYDGASSLYSVPIVGMDAYRSGMSVLSSLLAEAGRDNTDFSKWTEAEQTAFWNAFDTALVPFAQGIVDYCVENGYNDEGDVAGASANWGFSGNSTTVEDFAMEIGDAYGWSFASMEAEVGNSDSLEAMMDPAVYAYATKGVQTGESAASIEGIQRTGDYSMRVVTTEFQATTILQLTLTIAPLHYYGDEALYDYDANSFGFPKGDLSLVRAKTTQPMGAGPYKLIKFENGVINFEANELYYKGAPRTKYINFAECLADTDKLNGVTTGTVDITDPTLNDSNIAALQKINPNGELSGDVVETSLVDNNGYGYLALSAYTIKVGEDGGSEASKNLRKGLATVLAVYRDIAIDSYYGERASVIQYPISNTSWAAPRPSDDGYKMAFSTALDGSDIYTSGMTDEERYDAALAACLEYLEAAGYTVENGKLTAAPEGAKLEYTFWIPGDGVGDHPNFMVLTLAQEAFAKIGMNLIIKDLTNSSDLWNALDAQEADMWSAAWGNSSDPDMYQIYYADAANADGKGKNPWGGPAQGGDSYRYCIADEELDELIMDARRSPDYAYRKAMYKACLDIVVDWAVEIPSYQRQNCVVFSAERVDLSTVTPDITPFWPWLSEVELIALQ